jgi:hypothetical protein
MVGSGELHASFALLPWKGSLVPIEYVTGCVPHAVWTLKRREESGASSGNRTRLFGCLFFCLVTDMTILFARTGLLNLSRGGGNFGKNLSDMKFNTHNEE